MSAVGNQQPVKTLPADCANESLGDSVSLGRPDRRADDLDALGVEHRVERPHELAVVIADQEFQGSLTLGEQEDEVPRLLRRPRAVGVLAQAGEVHIVEILPSTDRPHTTIRCAEGMHVAMGATKNGVSDQERKEHREALEGAFAQALPGIQVRDALCTKDLRALIEPDLPVIYFLCHGTPGDRGTLLGIGQRDQISPQDLMGWMDVATMRHGRRMWTEPQPLVFINACESLAITPEDLVDYLGAFVGKGQAAGVIGTEIKVEQGQAMELAEMFFTKLLQPGATVEEALRHVRLSFLADGNLFGLVYTPYCFADLAIVMDPPSGPPEVGPSRGAGVAGPLIG